MEDKNQIKEINQRKEKKEEEIDQKLFSNYSKGFSVLLEEKNLQFKLLKHFYELDNFKLEKLIEAKNKMEELERDTTLDMEEITKIKDTPIFRLYIILKEINKIELNHLQKYNDYLALKRTYLISIGCFIQDYMHLDNYYKGIGPLKERLNERYRKIEIKSIDKYIEKEYKKSLTRRDKIISTDEIKFAGKTENQIYLFNKQNKKESNPNVHLKETFRRLKTFSNSIKEVDENKLNVLKKEINSLYELSEKGDIYEIWNFNAPMIQSEYKFNLFHISSIPLNDKLELNEKNKFELTKDKDNILKFIQDRKVEDIVLHLNTMAGEMLKSKNLINEILDTNSTQYKISKSIVEELMKLLVNYNNIRATLQVINDFRGKNGFQIKKDVFDIVIKIFEKAADYLLKNPDYHLADMLTTTSETYYYLTKIGEKEEKHFINDELKEHKLFKIEAFWEKFMRYRLNNEEKKLKISSEKIKRGELNEDEIKLVYSNILGAIVHFPLKKDTFGVPKESIERIVKKIIEKYPKKVQNLVLEFLSDQLSN